MQRVETTLPDHNATLWRPRQWLFVQRTILCCLLLNNRNQLLAEVRHRQDEPPPEVGQAVAKRAIQLHATALILVTCRPGKLQPTDRDMELTGCILRAATVLSITVHDHWLYGANKTVSLKRMGLL